MTPWADPSIEVWSLNDAYALGLPRADRWFEIHPLDRMVFHDGKQRIDPKTIPHGHFLRPKGHLEWLKTQAATIPVYLQHEPPADWPVNAQRFPIERVCEVFGESYWACGPSYMLALAVLEGYTEIWITGIHLSTKHEYLEQRPQWEHLLGRVLGPKAMETVKDGFRYYDGLIRLVLPESCPIMAHGWKYAYDERPLPPVNPYADELAAVVKDKRALMEALVRWPVGKDKARQIARLERLAIIEMDIQQQLAKRNIGGTLTAKLAA